MHLDVFFIFDRLVTTGNDWCSFGLFSKITIIFWIRCIKIFFSFFKPIIFATSYRMHNTKFWWVTSWNFCTSLSVTEWLTSCNGNKRKVRFRERLGRVLGCGFGFSRVHWTYYGTDEHSSVKWKYYASAQTARDTSKNYCMHIKVEDSPYISQWNGFFAANCLLWKDHVDFQLIDACH